MHHPIVKRLFPVSAFVALLISAIPAAHAAPVSADDLHTPDRLVEAIEKGQKAAYDETLASYRQAMQAHPADAALALAACTFSERFGMQEDLIWADAAWKDFNACEATVEKQYASDTDAALFILEHKFGKAAIDFGEPLVQRSKSWSTPQQARLHAALARAYALVKDDEHAGKEALQATQLDPASLQLVPAMRYLAKKGRRDEAANLLAAAPMPKSPWQEAARIRAATDLLPGNAAKDELHRAQRAALKIDAYTAARALEHVGDATGANAMLKADTASRKNETPQNRQFRLNVAFDAGDAKAAADIVSEEYATTHNATPLASAYAHLLRLDPLAIGRADMIPLAISLFSYLLGIVAAPGLLMFPVHYRGTVRHRIGKTFTPLFERIGLRHAWLGMSILFLALYAVTMLNFGGNISLSPSANVVRVDWQNRVAISHLWTLLFAAVGLVSVGRLLSWREWLGSGEWKWKWFLVPAVLLWYDLSQVTSNAHPLHFDWTNAPWAVGLVQGAVSLGGVPLALLVVSFLVPIMEELVFRGCLLGGLSRHLSFGWANLLQAVVFACMHKDGAHFFYLVAMGATAGWLTKKTKGLAVPMLLHAINNAIFVYAITG
jgi:membrane protease YdiL (CAAX protease family)